MKTLWKCIWYFLTVYDKVCGDSRVSACSYAGTSHSSVFHGTDLIPSAFIILILSAFSQVFPPFFLLTVYSTKPLSHWYRIMNQPRPACNNRAVLFFYSCTFYIQKEVPLFYSYTEECRQSHWMLVLPITPAHLPWDRWLQSVGPWWGQRRWGRLVSRNLQGRWSWAPRDWWPPVTRNTEE